MERQRNEAAPQPGQPDQWDEKRWAGFVEIIEFLKSKNVVFSTPSEFFASKSKP